MRLQARAALRRAVRGVRTPRGAIFFGIGLLVFGMWLGPLVFAAVFGSRGHRSGFAADPLEARQVAPALLLLFALASLFSTGDRALSFTPGEVNFLFAAPFTRRQLLGYKLVKSMAGALATGLVLSMVLKRHAFFWLAAFVGAFLSMLLIHLTTTCLVLAGQAVNQRAYNLTRRAVLLVVVALVVVAVGPAFMNRTGESVTDVGALLRQFSESPGGRVILAPFQPFGRAFTAESLSRLLLWGAAAAAVDAAMVALMMRLDANYLEAAAAASERVYERAQRARRGEWAPGIGASGGGGARKRRRVPPLPWLAGAGPLAWRQLAAVSHKAAGLLITAAAYGAVVVVAFFADRRGVDLRPIAAPAPVWLTLLLAGALRFDFRGDLDQMAWLKSLPLRPAAVAAGQLVTPVAMLTLVHLTLFASGAVLFPQSASRLAAAAVLALPFNLVLMGVENTAFLLYPARPAAPGELGFIGRQVVMFMVKLVVVATACGVAAACGAIVMGLTRSAPAALAVAFAVLAAEGAGVVAVTGLAFRRFDPSVDTPP